jgi:hypothetical protein
VLNQTFFHSPHVNGVNGILDPFHQGDTHSIGLSEHRRPKKQPQKAKRRDFQRLFDLGFEGGIHALIDK